MPPEPIQPRTVRLTMRFSLIPLVLAASLTALPTHAQRAARVKIDAVTLDPLTQTMPILGHFVARGQGVVAAAVDGPVDSVHAQVGQRVKLGQLLAELNGEMRAATLAQREAEQRRAVPGRDGAPAPGEAGDYHRDIARDASPDPRAGAKERME